MEHGGGLPGAHSYTQDKAQQSVSVLDEYYIKVASGTRTQDERKGEEHGGGSRGNFRLVKCELREIHESVH